jgi:hypothetical protein
VSSPHSSDSSNDASRGSGTRLRRPPAIWVLVLGLIVVAASTLLVVLLLTGEDEPDMEEQPEQRSIAVVGYAAT